MRWLWLLLFLGCATATPHVYPATVTFTDESELTAHAWVCVPGGEPASLRCMEIGAFLQWLSQQGRRAAPST